MAPTEHWADLIAEQVLRIDRPPVISTGISPSGEIHIGNMREVLTGDAVYRALRQRGANVGFNYVADNFDPLRRVYPFLDPERYTPLIGRPLSEIPCPCDGHESYASHFLEPFLEALRELHVEAVLERADLMYKSGRMTPYVIRALERRDAIAAILTEMTGKQVAEEWSPFNPLCAACGRINDAKVVEWSAADETIEYACGCGDRGTRPMAGGGKLVWRIDWPARWMLLGVTVEPFGKDHATRGGSYETGERIVREIFDGEPPFPIPYEWIRLSGGGDMSSSKGNVLSIARLLEVVPPEALRYLVIREQPKRRISFDPGLPLLQLVDEVDDATVSGRDERALELSRAGGFEPVGVPFKHLVVVAQVAEFDPQRVVTLLRSAGYPDVNAGAVARRVAYARRWLEEFAPEDLRFSVAPTLPAQVATLDPDQRRFLGRLAARLEPELDGDGIQALIHATAREFADSPPGRLFQAIYVALLGKARGPRAGGFIACVGAEYCARRFEEAAGGLK